VASVMVDSNVVLRLIAGEERLAPLFSDHMTYYNAIVFSEVAYHVILGETGLRVYDLKKSPEEMERARKTLEKIRQLFESILTPLPITERTETRAWGLMVEYHLLPNDAMILASAELARLDYLATYDRDLLRLKEARVPIVEPEEILE